MSKIEERVIDKIRTRAEIGEAKYGVTMERGDLNRVEWLNHLQEELLDGAIYIEKLKSLALEVNYLDYLDEKNTSIA